MMNQANSSDRPRFYELDLEPRVSPIYEFVNEDRAFIHRNRSGSHRVELPGTNFGYTVGVPTFAERASFILGSRTKTGEPLDFYGMAGFSLISSRFKALIDAIDPGAIEAAQCDTRNTKDEPLPPYWWIDVVRVLDGVVDEERSMLKYRTESAFASGTETDKLLYMTLQDVVFRPEVVDAAQLFRILRYRARPVVGQQLADAIRAAGLTGVFLTPLQPPLPDETRDHLAFGNYPYWTNKGYGQ